MTPITRSGLRLGLFWLLAGVFLAGLAESSWLNSYQVRPVWIHMLVLGWMTQWIFAISLWMFPRSKDGYRKRESLRTWSMLVCWNTALFARVLFEVEIVETAPAIRQIILGIAVLLFWIASVLYVIEIWPRVRVKKKMKRARHKGANR